MKVLVQIYELIDLGERQIPLPALSVSSERTKIMSDTSGVETYEVKIMVSGRGYTTTVQATSYSNAETLAKMQYHDAYVSSVRKVS